MTSVLTILRGWGQLRRHRQNPDPEQQWFCSRGRRPHKHGLAPFGWNAVPFFGSGHNQLLKGTGLGICLPSVLSQGMRTTDTEKGLPVAWRDSRKAPGHSDW